MGLMESWPLGYLSQWVPQGVEDEAVVEWGSVHIQWCQLTSFKARQRESCEYYALSPKTTKERKSQPILKAMGGS